jgi:hypothetical protein
LNSAENPAKEFEHNNKNTNSIVNQERSKEPKPDSDWLAIRIWKKLRSPYDHP